MEDRISGGLQHRHGRRACMVQRWHHRGDVVFQTGGLVYDNNIILLELSMFFLCYHMTCDSMTGMSH